MVVKYRHQFENHRASCLTKYNIITCQNECYLNKERFERFEKFFDFICLLWGKVLIYSEFKRGICEILTIQ